MDQKMLYLECNSGISGDMTVAALLDLGADQTVLENALKSLPVDGFRIEITRVKKSGLDACDFNVILDKGQDNHDHDMKYLHGFEHEQGASHHHGDHMHHHEEHTHDHGEQMHHHEEHTHVHEEHTHSHEGHVHAHHVHRGMTEVLDIINHADLTDNAKTLAIKVFQILANAEAKAHGVPVEQVHFHEVGAVDSIVDIVAAAVCLDNLGVTEAVIPVLYEGSGSVRCQHGILPVPVPAVAHIVADNGLKLSIMPTNGEFVTPTGAAIAAAIKTRAQLPKTFEIEKIGLGAGKRTYEKPSILRAMLIKEVHEETDTIWKLESNIDDSTGEELGYCMERLFAAGARDVHYFPVFMKKNRPAYQINVICTEKDIPKMEQIIFQETTTIGIRRMEMERTVLNRKEVTVITDLGKANVKVCEYGNETRYYPEYDSVIALSKESGLSYRQVYQHIINGLEE